MTIAWFKPKLNSMKGEILKVVFYQKEAYLSDSKSIPLLAINLPKIASNFSQMAFWKFKVLNFDQENGHIFANPLSYHLGETEFEENQWALLNQIEKVEKITFNTIDTAGLLKSIGKLENIVKEVSPPSKTWEDRIKSKSIYIEESFKVSFQEFNFQLGSVSFKKTFKNYDEELTLEIPNPHLRVEFNAVKAYFSNILKCKKVKVFAKIEIENGSITLSEIRSPEISKINPELIESVKFEFVKKMPKFKPGFEVNKSLFTMDEYFQNFSDDGSTPFFANEKELFDKLLEVSKSKHFKNLRFLADKHLYNRMKLRFILQPFSFIFLLEGPQNYHIVWETLNTEEATYIWHSPKDIPTLKLVLNRVEDIINTVKVQGKMSYISNGGDNFQRIYHDYSEMKDGFLIWKSEIEMYLN